MLRPLNCERTRRRKKVILARARDLYKQLTEMEPENALHAQNHRQMLAKLGEDSATRILTPEEAAQAFMVEELDESAPAGPPEL